MLDCLYISDQFFIHFNPPPSGPSLHVHARSWGGLKKRTGAEDYSWEIKLYPCSSKMSLSWWPSSSWIVSSRPCNVVPTTALFLDRQLGINKESNISRCLSILISQIWKQPKFFQNNCSWLRWSSSSGYKIRCPLSSCFLVLLELKG
jgi:hypothetical protein